MAPHTTGIVADMRSVAGSRPILAHPPHVGEALGAARRAAAVELVGVASGRQGRAPRTGPADDDLRPRLLHERREIGALVQLPETPLEAEALPAWGLPQPGDDLHRLLQAVEALALRRERDAERLVLALVPAGADPQADPPVAHLIDAGHRHRQNRRQPEGPGGHQRPQLHPRGLTGEAAEGRPRVRGQVLGIPGVDAHVMVGAKEGVEARLLGRPRHRDDAVVGGAVEGLHEHAQLHAAASGRGRGNGIGPPPSSTRVWPVMYEAPSLTR